MNAQSPTSISTFVTCPRQYEAKYVTKEVVFSESDNTRFGTAVHAAIEKALKGEAHLPAMLEAMSPLLEGMRALNASAETKLARDVDGNPCSFFDKNVYLRCVADSVIDAGELVVLVDWKTGKKRDHQIQHDVLRECAKANYPNARRIKTVFVYLFSGECDVQEHEYNLMPTELYIQLVHIHNAHKRNEFPPKPSGLCKQWCDVLSCPHNGRR